MGRDMFERYTEQARRVVFFARYEASAFGSTAIDTGHLLLGLLREGKGMSSRILSRHGLTHHGVGEEIQARQGAQEAVSTSVDIPLATDAKRALQHAGAEADRMQAEYIGTEHLLLGMLDEGEGVGASILADKGLSADAVREEMRLTLGAGEASTPPRGAFSKLVGFLAQLEERGAGYRAAPYLHDAIRVEVAAPGEMWVATFFVDGRVAVEVLSALGGVEDESALARLLDRLGPSGAGQAS
jgi:ATP-dependent Clp protease ATP-binding subunit ClpC